MTSRRNSRTYRDPQAARAKILAAREESTVQAEPSAREEPMHRWPHTIPMSSAAPAPVPAEGEVSPALTAVLEQLQCQSQLMVDLLGAVNSLTAAVLCQKGNGGE